MSAALIELVSVGAQDVYITGQPEVSFFRQNYKRYTNFAMKPERMDTSAPLIPVTRSSSLFARRVIF